ncbi:hypothetical protein DSL64_17260 [Dyadobacter luteus]|jgi:hypothetical protein|uniref:Lipoprotein n=1 Tax=Dyadobacter luteus TaxID=2259619 RepID=A0A3D8Y8U3_9BACT|nr:hypothetical protein [Dyadobacter luteus]REA59746.1 hypothetical protein DSL64_17260 [Dyadobacter luteus]
MKISALPFLLLLFFLSSCEWWGNQPSFEDDFITYTIKTGSHEVEKNTNSLFTGSSMKFQAVFDSSCIYKTVSPENQHDINKLMGFSDCSSQHHVNSARFGWNWRENALRIYAYIYRDGERQEKELGTAELGKTMNYAIRTEGNTYVFTFNGTETVMPRYCSGGTGVAYKLLPYFGGNEPSPKDIRIRIRNL